MPWPMGECDVLPPPPPLASLIAGGPIALFLDFDGTLVEIAPAPDAIDVPEGMASSLENLDRRLGHRAALVSGRSLEDIARHLGQVDIARAGSHGAACQWPDGSWLREEPRGLSEAVIGQLRMFAKDCDLDYEAKTHGGALHFRSNPDLADAALTFATEIAATEGLAVKTGKCVVELVQPGADKGGAVRAFMEQNVFAGSTPWFIGDDVTDEDGFAACHELGGGSILVGSRPGSAAQFSLPDVFSAREWLGL